MKWLVVISDEFIDVGKMSRSANRTTLCTAACWLLSALALTGCDTTPTLVLELENPLADANVVDGRAVIDGAVFDGSVADGAVTDGAVVDAMVLAGDASNQLCGNSVLDLGEICDPGIDFCCNFQCTGGIAAGIVCRPAFDGCDLPEVCEGSFTCPVDEVAAAVCGDGIICGGEVCDDGVFPPEEFDGCDMGCLVEPGFVCTGEPSVCESAPVTANSLDDAPLLPTGENDFMIGGSTIPLFVDNTFDGGGWILIGRGREGWAWNDAGAGGPAAVKDGLGTTSAFAPTYLSAALVQELMDNSINTPDITLVDVRIRRASAADGSNYQESVWIPLAPIGWTWLFDGGGPSNALQAPFGFDVDLFVEDSDLGLGGFLPMANTEDTIAPIASFGSDDHMRMFTRASSEHGLAQGFSYGTSVTLGDASPTSFMLNSGFDHSMPYTEIYIRGLPPQMSLARWTSTASRFVQGLFTDSASPDADSASPDQSF
ncbi:MAG: hypothetical protein JKY56_18855 [Kofleriaceae bacterium]|nr:hypothetical protein [Kofleriaceae bacterium]